MATVKFTKDFKQWKKGERCLVNVDTSSTPSSRKWFYCDIRKEGLELRMVLSSVDPESVGALYRTPLRRRKCKEGVRKYYGTAGENT